MKKILFFLVLVVSFIFSKSLTPPPFPEYGLIVPSSKTNSIFLQPKSNILQIKKGWRLFGYDKGIKDINKTFGSLASKIKIVWYYDDKNLQWEAYSPDINNLNLIKQYYKVLKNVPKYRGFWVLGLKDANITLNPDYNTPDKLIIGGIKTDQNLTSIGGEFDIYVSPLDIDGDLIADNISESNFKFANMYLGDINGSKVTDVNTTIKQILLHKTSGDNSIGNYIVLDIDSSGSMTSSDPNNKRKIAAKTMISLMSSNTLMSILDFGAGSSDGLKNSRLLQKFTFNKNLLNNAIDKIEANGGTPLYDSAIDTINILDNIPYKVNKSLIIFTDGEDTESSHTLENVIQSANSKNITIYTIGLGGDVEENKLKKLSTDTGGLYAFAENASKLNSVFTSIGSTSIKGYIDVIGRGVFTTNVPSGKYELNGKLIFEISGEKIETNIKTIVNIR